MSNPRVPGQRVPRDVKERAVALYHESGALLATAKECGITDKTLRKALHNFGQYGDVNGEPKASGEGRQSILGPYELFVRPSKDVLHTPLLC